MAIVSATPLSDSEEVPGLLAGQRILDGLRGALELVRGGVLEAASPGLEMLVDEMRRRIVLAAGPDPEEGSP